MPETSQLPYTPENLIELETDRPHPARVYDVLLGGTTNYPADRAAAEQVIASLPTAVASARINRAFIHRAARYLALEAGVHQFLDIGTGIPTSPNLHEIVQDCVPEARVVYADKDPIVRMQSAALRTSGPRGRTAYIEADVTDPDSILGSAELRGTIDLAEPVAVTLCLLLHWLPRDVDPYEVVARLLEPLPAGSHLCISHFTGDFDSHGADRIENDFEDAGSSVMGRSKEEIARFFDGLELVDPGVQVPQLWRPDPQQPDFARGVGDRDVPVYVGLARKN